tara:strand:- start:2728 stop:3582 length:855 start_codon:yes stop_codon:yes gene_type:complete
MDAYVLHGSADQVLARRLEAGLLGRDLRVSAGSSQAHAKHAKAVIVLWSPTSIRDTVIVSTASKARASGRLLQVKARPCDVPARFGETDGVILSGWDGEAADLPFQEILAGVIALRKGVGPGKSQPPRGLAWIDRRGRPMLLWIVAAVTAVAATAGIIANLLGAKDLICSAPGVYDTCRLIGWAGPPPEDVLSKLEGTWSTDNCSAEFTEFKPSADGRQLTMIGGGQAAAAKVDGKTEDSVSLIYEVPGGGVEDWKIVIEGPRLTVRELRDGAWAETRMTRCAR